MWRQVFFMVIAVMLLFAFTAEAGRVCRNRDCSDVVGDAMVKDNLGRAEHFIHRHHDDWKEEARVRRIGIKRREKNID